MAKKQRRDIYREVTNRVLEILDRGVVPWHNPMRSGNGDGWPKNLDSGKRYRGINVFLLAFQSWDKAMARIIGRRFAKQEIRAEKYAKEKNPLW